VTNNVRLDGIKTPEYKNHKDIFVLDVIEPEVVVDETVVSTQESTGDSIQEDYLNDHSYSRGVLYNCLNEIELLKETNDNEQCEMIYDDTTEQSKMRHDETTDQSKMRHDETTEQSKMMQDETSDQSKLMHDETTVQSEMRHDETTDQSKMMHDETTVQSKLIHDETTNQSKMIHDEITDQSKMRYYETTEQSKPKHGETMIKEGASFASKREVQDAVERLSDASFVRFVCTSSSIGPTLPFSHRKLTYQCYIGNVVMET
jgi:hypothetical protein